MMNTKNFNPKISIVIPVYNGSNYMREAIDSAIGQTYKNTEVIVINDGSTDEEKTDQIAKSYGDKIRYFYKENGGVGSALNMGIRLMTGEYFSWLSHDDVFLKNRLEEDVKLFSRLPEAKISFCRFVKIDGNGNFIREEKYHVDKVTNPREVMLLKGVDFCAMTVHKSCFDEVGYFNENNKTVQDVEMTLRLSKKFVFYLNDTICLYKREHEQRGFYRLKNHHEKDMKRLTEFVHSEYTIDDFFPDINRKDDKELAKAWEWMGDMYRSYRAYEYADQCYKNAQHNEGKSLSRIGLKYYLGSRALNNDVLLKLWKLYRNGIKLRNFNFLKKHQISG